MFIEVCEFSQLKGITNSIFSNCYSGIDTRSYEMKTLHTHKVLHLSTLGLLCSVIYAYVQWDEELDQRLANKVLAVESTRYL